MTLDAARSIETYVVDDPDAPAVVPRSRAITEELIVHVQVQGMWHRRTPTLAETSCGISYHGQFSALRRQELVGRLCPVCFTKHELAIAAAANRKLEGDT